MDLQVPTGGTVREQLESSARMGSKRARRDLDAIPKCPDEMRYLVDVARTLAGRSGCGPAGLLPVSFTTIVHWCELMGETLTPLEVEGLMALDGAILYPAATVKQEADAPPQPRGRKKGAA